MRTIIYIILFFFAVNISAQTGTDRVREDKVKYFNEKLDLSESEAKKFWPIYNDYQSRRNKISSERKSLLRFYNENYANLSSQEISETLDRYIELEKMETKLTVEYSEKFQQVLAKEKVLKIYITEVEFRNYLLKQLRTKQSKMKPRN